MPRGRSSGDRLEDLTRRLEALENKRSLESRAREVHRDYDDEELLEILLILLRHAHDGDTQAFADYLVQDGGLPFEDADTLAGDIGRILEERDGGVLIP